MIRTCVRSRANSGASLLCLGAAFLLVVGGWIALGAATFLAVFEWRSYAAVLQADSTGLAVTNRFFRHDIAWRDIRLVSSGSSSDELIPVVRIARTGSMWFNVGVYATLGMSWGQRYAVVLDLVELARQSGYEIASD